MHSDSQWRGDRKTQVNGHAHEVCVCVLHGWVCIVEYDGQYWDGLSLLRNFFRPLRLTIRFLVNINDSFSLYPPLFFSVSLFLSVSVSLSLSLSLHQALSVSLSVSVCLSYQYVYFCFSNGFLSCSVYSCVCVCVRVCVRVCVCVCVCWGEGRGCMCSPHTSDMSERILVYSSVHGSANKIKLK